MLNSSSNVKQEESRSKKDSELRTKNLNVNTRRSKRLKSHSDVSEKDFPPGSPLSERRDNLVPNGNLDIDPNCEVIREIVGIDNDTAHKSKGIGKKSDLNIDNTNLLDGILTEENNMHDHPPSSSKMDEFKVPAIRKIQSTNPKLAPIEEVKTDAPNTTDMYLDPQPSTSSSEASLCVTDIKLNKKRVNLYGPDSGPQMYHARGSLVTLPIITKNLPKVFEFLPVHGKPEPDMSLQDFYMNKIREYVGCGLTDEEFNDLENYCSPELLKTGNEIKMQTNVPIMGLLNSNILHNNFTKPEIVGEPPNLAILKKNKIRLEKDTKGLFTKKLKYRGVRIMPFSQEETDDDDSVPSKTGPEEPDVDLEPGSDILFRVRIYRPYTYTLAKDRFTRGRHSVFCCDVLLTGRHKLTALRDRFVCHNDFDMRVDISEHPDVLPTTKAKEIFPSGFLFINNVFYVDTREGCIDYSEPIREWAVKRNIGVFPKKDMCSVRLDELVLKLGYPEVYVHQGNCEHVFLFSEVRLLNVSDPLRFSNYPCSTAIAQNQTVYCTTCAEFSAKWIVVGSERVPFDPGFFCDTCFKQYMYKDGQKVGHFKAYRYRGNALNVLKPQ